MTSDLTLVIYPRTLRHGAWESLKAPCGCCPRTANLEDWNTSCYTNGAGGKRYFTFYTAPSPRSRGYPISISLYSLADRLYEFGVSSSLYGLYYILLIQEITTPQSCVERTRTFNTPKNLDALTIKLPRNREPKSLFNFADASALYSYLPKKCTLKVFAT